MSGYPGGFYPGGGYPGGAPRAGAPADDVHVVTDSAAASESAVRGGSTTFVGDLADAVDYETVVDRAGDGDGATASESAIVAGLSAPSAAEVDDAATAAETVTTTGLGSSVPPPPVVIATSFARFVPHVGADEADTRLDLTAAPWSVLFEGTSWEPAEMNTQRSSSMLVDGETVTGMAARNRILRVRLMLNASTDDDAAVALGALDRELDRDENVLWWQPTDQLPRMWLHTYRSPRYTPRLDLGIGLHTIDLEIESAPYFLGDPDSFPITISRDPSVSGNPCYVDLPAIKGDAATELYLTTTSTGLSQRRVAFAVRSRGTPANVPWYRQAEVLTPGTDAATGAGGTQASGPGQNIIVVDFGSGNNFDAQRLTGAFPGSGTPSRDWYGTYRMFVRARVSDSSTTVRLRGGNGMSLNRPASIPVGLPGPVWRWMDLDLVSFPAGNPGRNAGYGQAHAVAGSFLWVNAERIDGAGDLHLDGVMLLPADERYALVTFSTVSGGSYFVVDAPSGEVYPLNSAGGLSLPTGVVPGYDGDLPSVVPGAANRLFILAGVDTTYQMGTGAEVGTAMAIAGSDSFNVTVWPKYKTLRGDSS